MLAQMILCTADTKSSVHWITIMILSNFKLFPKQKTSSPL